MTRHIFLFLLASLIALSGSSAYAGNESIVSYIPSPLGNYDNLNSNNYTGNQMTLVSTLTVTNGGVNANGANGVVTSNRYVKLNEGALVAAGTACPTGVGLASNGNQLQVCQGGVWTNLSLIALWSKVGNILYPSSSSINTVCAHTSGAGGNCFGMLWIPAAGTTTDRLVLLTNGSPSVYISTQSGTNKSNVGLGDSAPGYKLSVVGQGGTNVDLSVTGRIMTGDNNQTGGVWLNRGQTQFVGANGTSIGFYNAGVWRFQSIANGNLAWTPINNVPIYFTKETDNWVRLLYTPSLSGAYVDYAVGQFWANGNSYLAPGGGNGTRAIIGYNGWDDGNKFQVWGNSYVHGAQGQDILKAGLADGGPGSIWFN